MDSAILDSTSQQYLGQWQRLVSTTNWEKGRIIHSWREALRAADLPAAAWSDDTWSTQVGSVTPQHVGRLRRVYERFGEVHDSYQGLYWSHFQAALDWDDAEMWLEGAVQNEWSIAQMRRTRWETLGAPAELQPRDEDVVASDWDEDAEAADASADEPLAGHVAAVRAAHDAGADEARFDETGCDEPESEVGSATDEDSLTAEGDTAAEPVRPFAHLASLPADLSEAFEAFKLGILRHKLADWAEVSRGDVLAALDALKELALARGGVGDVWTEYGASLLPIPRRSPQHVANGPAEIRQSQVCRSRRRRRKVPGPRRRVLRRSVAGR